MQYARANRGDDRRVTSQREVYRKGVLRFDQKQIVNRAFRLSQREGLITGALGLLKQKINISGGA